MNQKYFIITKDGREHHFSPDAQGHFDRDQLILSIKDGPNATVFHLDHFVAFLRSTNNSVQKKTKRNICEIIVGAEGKSKKTLVIDNLLKKEIEPKKQTLAFTAEREIVVVNLDYFVSYKITKLAGSAAEST